MFVQVNTLDDALDLKRFVSNPIADKIVCWKSLFGIRDEYACKQQAKGLVRRMLELMAQDMVHGRDAFVFPKRNFGYLSIGRLDGKHDTSKYYKDNSPLTRSTYGGIVTLTKEVQWENGRKRYFFKLVTPFIEQIRKLKQAGYHW